jgi:hypothetical protein
MVDYKQHYRKFKEDLRTRMGRNVLTFLIFLLISTVFWFLMALNDEVQRDFKIPVKLEGFPKDMTVISGGSSTITVSIKDKGSTLAKFSWGSKPALKLRFDDFNKRSDNHLILSESQLSSAVRDIFGSGAAIMAIRPDSLNIHYTTNPGVPVKIAIDADISTLPQYEAYGAPILSTDTVMLYSNLKERLRIKAISTSPISLSRLSDTTTVEVSLVVPEGMRAVPSTVKITFPVEPLVSKTRSLNVEAINLPAGTRLITFPTVVEAKFLVPKSVYTTTATSIKAVVDYNNIVPGNKTIPVTLTGVPEYYQNAYLPTKEVEYLIEKQ